MLHLVFLSNNTIAAWPNFCKRQTGLHNFTPKILIHLSKPVIVFCYECLKNCPKKFQMSEQYLDCLDKMSEVNFSPAETLCSNGPGHMTKMAATPIYGKKPFKNLLLQNQTADDLGTWYVAFGLWGLQSLFK